MTATSDLTRINIADIPTLAPVLFETKTNSNHPQPFVILSSPGQAKSDTIEGPFARAIEAYTDRPVHTITEMVANKDPMDLNGFAFPVKRESGPAVARYTVPPLIERIERITDEYDDPEHPVILIFLDEIAQADQLTQKVIADLLLNYRLGEYVLPPNCWIVGAGNMTTDGAGANRLLTHLTNRLRIFTGHMPVSSWIDWAARAGLPALGRAYAERFSDEFTSPKVDRDGPFLTYRSFTSALRLLAAHQRINDTDTIDTDSDLLWAGVEGSIGTAHATEFRQFCRVAEHLPKLSDILDHPASTSVPYATEIDVAYALCGELEDYTHGRHPKHEPTIAGVAAVCEYATRLPIPELAARVIYRTQTGPNAGSLLNSAVTQQWLADHTTLVARLATRR